METATDGRMTQAEWDQNRRRVRIGTVHASGEFNGEMRSEINQNALGWGHRVCCWIYKQLQHAKQRSRGLRAADRRGILKRVE
jgi:hypothetical protein